MAEKKMESWFGRAWPYLLTGAVVIVIVFVALGWAAYAVAGTIPLIGGAIRNKMRKKVGLPEEKVKVIAPGRGIGNKERREN